MGGRAHFFFSAVVSNTISTETCALFLPCIRFILWVRENEKRKKCVYGVHCALCVFSLSFLSSSSVSSSLSPPPLLSLVSPPPTHTQTHFHTTAFCPGLYLALPFSARTLTLLAFVGTGITTSTLGATCFESKSA
eukprot:m.234351 g.234351  ORF g.234351 m.234351 type:complete len:135 (-) comp26518_c0_seq11:25-429(-)